MSELLINKENLKKHANLWEESMNAFTEDSVSIDYRVDLTGYSNLKEAKVFSSRLRNDVKNASATDVNKIYKVVSIMETLDENIISNDLTNS